MSQGLASVDGADHPADVRSTAMKVMVLGKATARSEAGELGSVEEFVAMGQYMEKLVEAGVLVAGDGLQPSSKGKRVVVDADGSTRVIDGPFAETKELIAGFSIWEVASMDEAVEWAKRSPLRDTVVELRKILDADDFDDSFTAELAAAEERVRAEPAAE
jgi:hypothetical protein